MSRLLFTGTTAEVALTAATAKTILQVTAPSNHIVVLLAWGVYFDGISTTGEPVVVRLLRQTTAGTMTSLTLVKMHESRSETIQSTAQHTATAEPTAGNTLERMEIHPQQGFKDPFPLYQEYEIQGGGRIGIECTAPANVNAIAWVKCEE